MNQKVYLIDGSGYIFRAYYGVQQALTTKSGLPTNALYGFTRMLLKFLRELKEKNGDPPLHIAMVFDAARKNYRHDLYPEYKANRAECPEDLVPQMPYFRKIASALGFPVFEKEGFEADDLIASFVRSAREEGREVVIVSADKDLTQLVDKDVIMWDPMRDVLFDEKKVEEQFGVPPALIRDYLSLVGDSSDNIPGAKGVGPKTAVQLLHTFKSLEALLENLPKVSEIKGLRGAKGVQTKLESSLDLLRLSSELVRLEDTVQVHINDTVWNGFNSGELSPLLDTLEFRSLFEDLSIEAPGDTGAEEKKGVPEKVYQRITSEELLRLVKNDPPEMFLAVDTETDSLDPLRAQLLGVSVSWKPFEAYYISVADTNGRSTDPELLSDLKKVLSPLLENASLVKCGSNLKYDIRVLAHHGIRLEGPLFDTMVASHVLHPDGREHGLKSLSVKYLGEEMTSFAELTDGHDALFAVPLEDLARYAAHDADASLRIANRLLEDLKKNEKEDTADCSQLYAFDTIEMPLIPVLAAMEDNGIKVDLDILADLEQEFSKELAVLTSDIYNEAGEEFNINSPKQLSKVLFEDLGLTGLKKTQSGFSTNASVLYKLQGQHPIIDHLLEYREVHKLQTTYVQSLQRLVKEETSRIHASFNQAIAATGRLSSSDPNLQNIPIRTPRGRRLREVFVADEGNHLIMADYSQVELRVLAHLSGDENLIQAFRDGEDIHASTARELFGSHVDEDPSGYRRIAKTINFGVIYGMGAFRLAGDLGVSRAEAQDFIDAYFERYKKVRVYFDRLKEDAESRGYVKTLFGRRRYTSDLDMEGRDKGYAARSMMNAPIQGTAAEIIKLAMIHASKEFYPHRDTIRLVLQVHDELVFEVPEAESAEIASVISSEMESAVSLDVPLRVDVRTGKSWGK
jgi:DNA polymerase I